MTISDEIRALAATGLSVSEIAGRLGVRYQFAYGVIKRSGSVRTSQREPPSPSTPSRPPLQVREILSSGFERIGLWTLGESRISLDGTPCAKAGVYAFAIDDLVQYVGVASKSLAKRLYFYGRPGASQRTNIRLNEIIRNQAAEGNAVEIYTACPPDLAWKGFQLSGAEGLEAWLIRNYHLPWNVRGAR